MKDARKSSRGAVLASLLCFAAASAQEISLPANWPADEMVFGYALGVLEDAIRGVKAPADELTRNLYAYPHRNVSMQLNQQGEIDTATTVNAIWELAGTLIPQIRGWDGYENERHIGIGVTMSVFSAEIGDAQVDVRDERVAESEFATAVDRLAHDVRERVCKASVVARQPAVLRRI